MPSKHKFEPIKEIKKLELIEIEKEISNSIPFLEKNLNRLLGYLKKEDELENYIEIDLPYFDSNLSFKLNLYYGRILISVMSHDDSDILGHLIIEGFDCIGVDEIKKLGDWRTHQEKLPRFKSIQE